MTCSRVHPPLKILALESEKLHFRLGTVPASVDCRAKLSGFWRSNCAFVPPGILLAFRRLIYSLRFREQLSLSYRLQLELDSDKFLAIFKEEIGRISAMLVEGNAKANVRGKSHQEWVLPCHSHQWVGLV